ncbi:unannotated protein [freshwater metagenome]|uniref:Unannotated protein n=1 Tax=freshwater metagenome TaxID=449393 RepID=A0A6J7RS27_9ZZZZ
MAVVTAEYLDVNDLADLAVRNLERGVSYFTSLLAEDRTQQTLFWGEFGLSLWRDLAHEDVPRVDLGTDTDDSALVKIGQDFLGEVRNIPSDLFWAELCVSCVDLMLLDVNRGEDIITNNSLVQDDGIFEVVALPWHKGHEQVLTKGEFAVVGRGTFSENIASFELLTFVYTGTLIDAGVLVGTLKLVQFVGALARLFVVHNDMRAVNFDDNAILVGKNHVGCISCRSTFDSGTDVRGLCTQQWNCLTLHVGTHECTVCIIVFQEWNERSSNGHDLPWRHVHQLNFIWWHSRNLGGSTKELVTLKLQAKVRQ